LAGIDTHLWEWRKVVAIGSLGWEVVDGTAFVVLGHGEDGDYDDLDDYEAHDDEDVGVDDDEEDGGDDDGVHLAHDYDVEYYFLEDGCHGLVEESPSAGFLEELVKN
jgi:hypothetical protein